MSWRWCCLWMVLGIAVAAPEPPRPLPTPPPAPPGEKSDFLDIRPDGGYQFAYKTGDAGRHYHSASATPDNTVLGEFGYRDPETGGTLTTRYTAGKRGFRAQGKHIHRHMDLSQNKIPYHPPVSPDSSQYNPTYSTYHDPNEDPSYSFGFRTPTYSRNEAADSRGHVEGKYSFVDDVGLRHNVEYEAGSGVGFHVKSPHPESNPIGPGVFFSGPSGDKKGGKPRGHTSVVRGKDGSYRFTAVGPDQRRQEVSDSTGHVRGSYTYIDDKGVQRTTSYIAGPNIGYKVVNTQTNNKYPVFPYLPSPYPPYLPDKDPIFPFEEAAASGGKPSSGGSGSGGNKKPGFPSTGGGSSSSGGGGNFPGGSFPGGGGGGGGGGAAGSGSGGGGDPEDPWPSPDSFDGSTPSPGSSTTGRPSDNSDLFGSGGNAGNAGTGTGSGDDEDDIQGFDGPPETGTGAGSFLASAPSNIPYGNCCKLGPNRSAAKHKSPSRPSRKPDASLRNSDDDYSNVRDSFERKSDEFTRKSDEFTRKSDDLLRIQEEFVGFPPGVPVRAHVFSLDLKPYGSRLPSPGAAIELPEVGKSRRGVEKSLSLELEAPDYDGFFSSDSWGNKARRETYPDYESVQSASSVSNGVWGVKPRRETQPYTDKPEESPKQNVNPQEVRETEQKYIVPSTSADTSEMDTVEESDQNQRTPYSDLRAPEPASDYSTGSDSEITAIASDSWGRKIPKEKLSPSAVPGITSFSDSSANEESNLKSSDDSKVNEQHLDSNRKQSLEGNTWGDIMAIAVSSSVRREVSKPEGVPLQRIEQSS